MKKILLAASVAFLLVGCADDQKPNPYYNYGNAQVANPLLAQHQALYTQGLGFTNTQLSPWDCYRLGEYGYNVWALLNSQRFVANGTAAYEFQRKINEMARKHREAITGIGGYGGYGQCPVVAGMPVGDMYARWAQFQRQMQYGAQNGYYNYDNNYLYQNPRAELYAIDEEFVKLRNEGENLLRSQGYSGDRINERELGNFLFKLGNLSNRAEAILNRLSSQVGGNAQQALAAIQRVRANPKRSSADLEQMVRELDVISRELQNLSRVIR